MKMKWFGILCLALIALLMQSPFDAMAGKDDVTQGTLKVLDKEGKAGLECPLRHTDVNAEISGFMSRVTVKQIFHNPMKEKIEAVYVFPLPSRSAVDRMDMKVGKRIIKGDIKKKEEARKIYDDAKKHGHVASLLEQERPNIFTQSVANIMPGEEIEIIISYVEYLNYQDGVYEFSFPMVVGPRYIPGNASGASGTGWAEDTDKVPDASRITPPVTPKGTRAGHDISLTVSLDAGVPVRKIRSVLHKVTVEHRDGSPKAKVTIDQQDSIPNKDFILQYETAGKEIEDAVLCHSSKALGGFFSLILQPPQKPVKAQITPKEMIFVIDTSGSQQGWPIEKAKETMKYCIENMNEDDTFNLIAFSNEAVKLFTSPKANTKQNREKALDFLAHRLGSGGTEMMPAMMAALEPPIDRGRLRIVTFMTDGYVGNDMEIIDTVKKHIGQARLFSFGVGNSCNRYLLDKMAEMGRGEVEYVTLNRHGDEVAEAFQRKIGTPLLTDISIDWAGLPVSMVYPGRHPDLFSGKPLIITGRYRGGSRGEIIVKGMRAGSPYAKKIAVTLPADEPSHDVLASLWARTRIEDLMDQDLQGIQAGKPMEKIKDEITSLGLKFRLMTQFTSFVAVEEKVITEGGVPRTVAVPVEMPDGVSYDGVFGDNESKIKAPSPSMQLNRCAILTPAGSGSNVKPGQPPSSYAVCGGNDEYGGARTERQIAPEEKYSAALKVLAENVKSRGIGATAPGVVVKDGRVCLIVTVTHLSDVVMKELKALGFQVELFSASGKMVRGTIGVDRLESLVKKPFVRKIEPFSSGKA